MILRKENMIRLKAPMRIDLAGGTLDIYPLYLFEGFGLTVNAAINLYATAEVEKRSDRKIKIYSEDLGVHCELNLDQNKNNIKVNNGKLSLITRLVKFYQPNLKSGLNIKTSADAPKGSGLGGSSAMAMTLSTALNKFSGNRYSVNQIIDLTCNIEAQDMGIPAGKQDHYAASHGGINAIWFRECGNRVERLEPSADFISEMQQKIKLIYTGQSRFSGAGNWDIFKRYVDGDIKVRKAMKGIKKASLKMRQAILDEKIKDIGKALSMEWNNRQKLSPMVSTPYIEKLVMEKKAKARVKFCGAGGGGCLIAIFRDKDLIFDDNGNSTNTKLINFNFDMKGLICE